MKLQLPVLPWKKHELEPFLSAEAIECHYYGHHQTYVDKTNDLTAKLGLDHTSLEKIILNYDGALYDNASQAWNHTFFWMGLKPVSAPPREDSELMRGIDAHFGSLDAMKAKFIECGSSLFGSGWTWLISDESGELSFINTHNGDNPIRFENSHPLWCCDIWEHAYYIDYRNQRKEFLEGAWKHVNWEFVEDCLRMKRIPNMTKLMAVDSESPHTSLQM